ncbi:AmmeMemoRadiSam system radical SAM enzyme [Candidatus Omnitrophota bacterium]
MYYTKLEGNKVNCQLCPRRCIIADTKRGFCGVRENRGGTLYTLVYGKPCAVHVDPIEKKPLFHFFPKSRAFSIATVGCNLRCKFCQNWQISQAKPEDVKPYNLTPEEIVKKAIETSSRSIAYTYTEPTVFYEYMIAIAKIAKEKGVKNVMHSAGHINEEPLRRLCKYLDAANIDLKGFSSDYYATMSLGDLDSVLRTLKILDEEGVWVEITNLVVPGLNDDPELIKNMSIWIKENLGAETPLHFSRFHPMYKLTSVSPTPVKTLERARKIAIEVGLHYVYIGNVGGHSAESTYCPVCKKMLIERAGYSIGDINIKDGKCKFCSVEVDGVWK